MTEKDAKEALEIFEMQRNKHMVNMPPSPYYDMVVSDKFTKSLRMAIQALDEIRQYRSIGTVEEFREAVERRRAKKPIKDEYNHDCCPNCGWIVYRDEWGGRYLPYCENCGQAISWEESEGEDD